MSGDSASDKATLRQAPGETAVEACEKAIRRSLLAGDYAPGERLPPERSLAEELGVNRTTLRAALGRLASARLLEVRQGSGYLVQDYREVAGLELLPDLAELSRRRGEGIGPMVAELLEVRRRIAVMALERIATRGRAQTLDGGDIERAIARFAELACAGASIDALADADLRVTAAVLGATGSPVLGLILNPVSFVVRELEPLRRAIYREPRAIALRHQLLLQWVRAPEQSAIPLVLAELERQDAETVRVIDES